MPAIRLEWAQYGDFDSFTLYRSNSVFTESSLPAPLATDIKTMFYADFTVTDGETYNYMVACHRAGEAAKYTSLVAIDATDVINEVRIASIGNYVAQSDYLIRIPYPPDIRTGDLLLCFLSGNEDYGVFPAPVGFTLIPSVDWKWRGRIQKVFFKRATGSEAGVIGYYTDVQSSQKGVAQIIGYRSGNPAYMVSVLEAKVAFYDVQPPDVGAWYSTETLALAPSVPSESMSVLSFSAGYPASGAIFEDAEFVPISPYPATPKIRLNIAHRVPATLVSSRVRRPDADGEYENHKLVSINLHLIPVE